MRLSMFYIGTMLFSFALGTGALILAMPAFEEPWSGQYKGVFLLAILSAVVLIFVFYYSPQSRTVLEQESDDLRNEHYRTAKIITQSKEN